MVYIIGSDKTKQEQEKPLLDARVSRRDFLRYLGATAAGLYLEACKGMNPYDADKDDPKPPEKYTLTVKLSGLYNGQPIGSFRVKAEGPETTDWVDAVNGTKELSLLKGPYRIILSNGPFYGGSQADPAHPTRYVNLTGPTEFPVDLVENGSIDFTFLEDILGHDVGSATERWATTPSFDIYRRTSYNGNTYEFSDSDINVIKQIIQNDVPQMARGKQFQMGVPQVTVKEETFADPAAPFVDNLIITYPFYYTSQARAAPKNNVLWAGKWPVKPSHLFDSKIVCFHELLHCFGFDDVMNFPDTYSIMGRRTGSTGYFTINDLNAAYYLNSYEPGTKRFNVVPQPSWFSGLLSAAMRYYSSVAAVNAETERDTIGNITSFGRSRNLGMRDIEMRARRDEFEEEMMRANEENAKNARNIGRKLPEDIGKKREF